MFGANPRNVPVLRAYQMASNYHDKVKPIRGRAVEYRPVGTRRSACSIRKDEATQDIVIKLYHTDIIRYKPDEDIVIELGGYTTNTTVAWLNALLPTYFLVRDNKVWTGCRFEPYAGEPTVSGEIPLHNRGPNIFRRRSDLYVPMVFVNPRFPTVHTINRKAMNAVRKEYADYLTYLKNMEAVLGGWDNLKVTWEQRRECHSYQQADVAIEAALSGNPEEYYKIVCGSAWRGGNPATKFNRILVKRHHERVLVKHEIRDGRSARGAKDNYAWAVD